MKYDPVLTDVVFLGPSLDVGQAGRILAANYLAPVRMGDIYRLIATGVRRICIIDGVFHATTPVWQREILAALQAGIQVIGAASMGALRALELAPYGMIGYGQVYRWYAQGVIAGDDEVALLHATAEFGYQPLSQALVDMRYTLSRAVDAGIIDHAARNALLAHQKSLCFTERDHDSLLASPPCQTLLAAQQAALAAFLRAPQTSLKALDAAEALRFMAGHNAVETAALAPRRAYIPRREALLMRGVPTAEGDLVPMHAVLAGCAAQPGLVVEALASSRRRFFLLEWMADRTLSAPAAHGRSFRAAWMARHAPDDVPAWCRAHGLTGAELDAALAERAAEDWLLRRADPADFGLEADGADRAACYIADWARCQGVEVPAERRRTPSLLANWVLEHDPVHFGLDHWCADLALTREIQLTSALLRFMPAAEPVLP